MFVMSKFTIKMANADAEAVIGEFFDSLEAMNIERFANVWHQDGVVILPFSNKGFPTRIGGIDKIRRQYGSFFMRCKLIRIGDRVFHFGADHTRVWAEFRSETEIKATGMLYSNSYVSQFTFREAKILEYMEYFRPFLLQESLGGNNKSGNDSTASTKPRTFC
jgi:ketosteroid isomerase-like protein